MKKQSMKSLLLALALVTVASSASAGVDQETMTDAAQGSSHSVPRTVETLRMIVRFATKSVKNVTVKNKYEGEGVVFSVIDYPELRTKLASRLKDPQITETKLGSVAHVKSVLSDGNELNCYVSVQDEGAAAIAILPSEQGLRSRVVLVTASGGVVKDVQSLSDLDSLMNDHGENWQNLGASIRALAVGTRPTGAFSNAAGALSHNRGDNAPEVEFNALLDSNMYGAHVLTDYEDKILVIWDGTTATELKYDNNDMYFMQEGEFTTVDKYDTAEMVTTYIQMQ